MTRIKRGGFVFLTWTGDHAPYHVHVYRDGQLVVKWDLENEMPMKGKVTAKILSIIEDLKDEGRI